MIDSVSGLAGAELRFDEWNLDYVLTGSQKAMALPSGLAFAVASDEVVALAKNAENRGVYFDIVEMERYAQQNQVPATPAFSLLYALEVQLEAFRNEGIESRWQRHSEMLRATSEWLDESAKRLGVKWENIVAPGSQITDGVDCSPAGIHSRQGVRAESESARHPGGYRIRQACRYDVPDRTHGRPYCRDAQELFRGLRAGDSRLTQISVSGAMVQFGATTLFRDVTFTAARGDRWGIIGRNGTGKTTLFRLITGEQEPTAGTIARQPGLRVSLLEQHRDFGDAATVWEAAAGQFADLLALEQSLAAQAIQIGELGEASTPAMLARYDRDLEKFDREGGYTFAPRVDAVLHGLGFDPVEARTRPLTQLSGGERGRLGVARQLVSPADVLLLDEPTNHLDLDTTRWLEEYLQSTDKTILLISHDRAFLANVVDHVLHFEGDTTFAYTGGYESFIEQREQQRLTQQRAFDKQQKFIANQEDYVRRNLAGQNSRQAKGRRKLLERLPRLSASDRRRRIDGSPSQCRRTRWRSGSRRGARSDRHRRPRCSIETSTSCSSAGEIVGLIGPNGAGKSTLLRTLLGETRDHGRRAQARRID